MHEATELCFLGVAADAYHSCPIESGAACETQDILPNLQLSWYHSVRNEIKYKNPLQAATDAWNLRWEVLHDLSHCNLLSDAYFPATSLNPMTSCISQESLPSKHNGMCVRFADCIDVWLGDHDTGLFYGFQMRHDWLCDWPSKPWSRRRVHVLHERPTPTIDDPIDEIPAEFFVPCPVSGSNLTASPVSILTDHQAPLSLQAVLSRFSDCDTDFATQDDFSIVSVISHDGLPHADDDTVHAIQWPHTDADVDQAETGFAGTVSAPSTDVVTVAPPQFQLCDLDPKSDTVWLMQISGGKTYDCKHDEFQPSESALQSSLQSGNADTAMRPLQEANDASSSEQGFSADSSPDMPTFVEPPPDSPNRQDVLLFHLHDDPIRTFLDWSSYESMITEVAHHFSVHRQGIIDVYETSVPLHDLPPDVTPIIVHLLNDIPLGQAAKLVLIDLEVHGHRIEPHFRLGPAIQRYVSPVPEWSDREGVLTIADVERYCKLEGGRCLAFHNSARWPDYDLTLHQFVHGDTVRIAIPPSDRIECPTDQLITWTQQDLTDVEIMQRMDENLPAEGYSPSLLDEGEVLALATPNLIDAQAENDVFHAMQFPASLPLSDSNHEIGSNGSSDDRQADWFLDLHRLIDAHASTCNIDANREVAFPVNTWFLDQESSRICNAPRIAMIGGDPSTWEADLIFPWRYQITARDLIFLDVVSPSVPLADIEDHVANILITQKPTVFSSALLALEFLAPNARSIFVRFAVATPPVSTRDDIASVVPLFSRLPVTRLVWEHPMLDLPDQSFQVHNGMGIRLKVQPEPFDDDSHPSISDSHSFLQTDLVQGSLVIDSGGQTKDPPSCSIMDELIEAVNAANNAIENQLPQLDTSTIEAQPESFRDLWERLTDQAVDFVPDLVRRHRLESWFLDHSWDESRCLASRIILIDENFLSWRASIAAVWQDRLTDGAEFSLTIVHPESEDKAEGALAQVIVTIHAMPDRRSTLLSVYDSDPELERSPFTFAIVLPSQFELDELLRLLALHPDCPPLALCYATIVRFGLVMSLSSLAGGFL